MFHGLLVVFVVLTFSFFLVRLTGDPVGLIVGNEATEEQIQQVRHALLLDKPLWQQYGFYLGGALHGNFGRSLFTPGSAMHLVLDAFPRTVLLTTVAMGLTILIALPIGLLAAAWPGSLTDRFARLLSVLGQCTPVFFLGILLILLFSVKLRWFPFGGYGTWRHLIMPGLTLAAVTMPIVAQVTRSALMESLRQDYVRTARSMGVSEARILLKHTLRNAALVIVTVVGLRLGFVIGGAVVTETVFSFPGLGRLAVQAVINRDFPVVQALLVVVSASVVAINLALDWVYVVLDPRVRDR